MRGWITSGTLVVAAWMVAGGCAVIEPPPARVYAYQTVTEREIAAAAGLTFDNDRVRALEAIARRPGLAPHEQVRLVDTAYRRLTFANSKVGLLNALIENPEFCNAAKVAILDGMGRHLAFESDKQAILKALDRRGPLAM